jgi:hypothetical protein
MKADLATAEDDVEHAAEALKRAASLAASAPVKAEMAVSKALDKAGEAIAQIGEAQRTAAEALYHGAKGIALTTQRVAADKQLRDALAVARAVSQAIDLLYQADKKRVNALPGPPKEALKQLRQDAEEAQRISKVEALLAVKMTAEGQPEAAARKASQATIEAADALELLGQMEQRLAQLEKTCCLTAGNVALLKEMRVQIDETLRVLDASEVATSQVLMVS